ncbi:collagenase [Micromonospora mangrovi]|uniref:microbial collagenase n=2 Tax=Micromonospora TaxID=1873 RepID=A0AAU8HLL9_9ACTN
MRRDPRRQRPRVLLALSITTVLLSAGAVVWTTTHQRHPVASSTSSSPIVSLSSTDTLNHVSHDPKPLDERAPLPASHEQAYRSYDDASMALKRRPVVGAAPPTRRCATRDYTDHRGADLVDRVKGSTTECIAGLSRLGRAEGNRAFEDGKLTTIVQALAQEAGHRGNPSRAAQLALYLSTGHAFRHSRGDEKGQPDQRLAAAARPALDTLFANPANAGVTDANGEILTEALVLADELGLNRFYLPVVSHTLSSYGPNYNRSWWMVNAVNQAFTLLFDGHRDPDFVAAVRADPLLLDTLHTFARKHEELLGTEQDFLVVNAGRELGRFLQYDTLRDRTRKQVRDVLAHSERTGPTAALWVGTAEMADTYDRSSCAAYRTCGLAGQLNDVLVFQHTCSPTLRIRAQQMTTAEAEASCRSLLAQDDFFHRLVRDPGPVAADNNTALEVVVYNSSSDYRAYAGATFGIDTNNGGMYLEGNPAAAGNQARFIAYEAEWSRPSFEIWNLNHEYTHYLDGRFDMRGDFGAATQTPTVWWIEGFAEYVSYHYRGQVYSSAVTEAGRRTYSLSSLFNTVYGQDSSRVYSWGYLAVRHMIENHRSDVDAVLRSYRAGDYAAARQLLTSAIGTRYDSSWFTWLAACASGGCQRMTVPSDDASPTPSASTPAPSPSAPTPSPSTPDRSPSVSPTASPDTTLSPDPGSNRAPTASFTHSGSGRTVSFTDTSSDVDGRIVARTWDFGDGSTSGTGNPRKTYRIGGTYAVRLTVTDDQGATATVGRSVTVGSVVRECAGADRNSLGLDCQRTGRAAASGSYDYLWMLVPAGTDRLRISSAGGTGDCDLYYDPDGWASRDSYLQRSTAKGNAETFTVTAPRAGYHYISLSGRTGCAGVTVSVTR